MKKLAHCTIYLVRHGRTDWNDKKIIQGHTNTRLNKKGQDTARKLAKYFKNIKFDKVYSSDLLRAKETAEIIALEHQLEVEITKALRERYFGPFQGMSFNIIKKMDEARDKLTDTQRHSYIYKGIVESDEQIMNRFISFIRGISIINLGKTVLIMTHSGMIRTFLIQIGVLNNSKNIRGFNVKNLAFVEIESDGINFSIKKLSGVVGIDQQNSIPIAQE